MAYGHAHLAALAAAKTLRAAIRDLIDQIASGDFDIVVEGDHGDGLSNDELLGFLAARGWDFLKVTPQLRAHVKAMLSHAFDGTDTLEIDWAPLAEEAAAQWVEARFERRIRDVPLRLNDPKYAAYKRRHGLDGRPGMATGALHDAIAENLRLTIEIAGGTT